MNTRAHKAVLSFARGMSAVAERPSYTPELSMADCQRYEEDKLCESESEYGAWISNASMKREPSRIFGRMVSNQELVRLTIARDSSMLERAQACEELRKRYLNEYAAHINYEASRARREQSARFAGQSVI